MTLIDSINILEKYVLLSIPEYITTIKTYLKGQDESNKYKGVTVYHDK